MRQSVCFSILALAAAGLSGCGQSAKESDATKPGSEASAVSVDPAKTAQEVAFQFQPGLYRTTITVQKVDMPGAPPQAAAQLKSVIGKSRSSEHCMSAEQAAKGMDAMKEGMAKGKCSFNKFEASGGKLASSFSCQGGQGMSIHSESTGSYSPTGSEVFITADSSMPGGASMHIEQTVKSERIGDCKK